jgi:hypothetical protein
MFLGLLSAAAITAVFFLRDLCESSVTRTLARNVASAIKPDIRRPRTRSRS